MDAGADALELMANLQGAIGIKPFLSTGGLCIDGQAPTLAVPPQRCTQEVRQEVRQEMANSEAAHTRVSPRLAMVSLKP